MNKTYCHQLATASSFLYMEMIESVRQFDLSVLSLYAADLITGFTSIDFIHSLFAYEMGKIAAIIVYTLIETIASYSGFCIIALSLVITQYSLWLNSPELFIYARFYVGYAHMTMIMYRTLLTYTLPIQSKLQRFLNGSLLSVFTGPMLAVLIFQYKVPMEFLSIFWSLFSTGAFCLCVADHIANDNRRWHQDVEHNFITRALNMTDVSKYYVFIGTFLACILLKIYTCSSSAITISFSQDCGELIPYCLPYGLFTYVDYVYCGIFVIFGLLGQSGFLILQVSSTIVGIFTTLNEIIFVKSSYDNMQDSCLVTIELYNSIAFLITMTSFLIT